jgi:hypothetical protein
MNKIIILIIVLFSQALESVAQIGNFYNDSIIERHESIADSLISQRTKYYDLGEKIKNSILTNTLTLTEEISYLNPGFKVFQDTVRDFTNFPLYNLTQYMIYDNGGLDKILDSLGEIMVQVGTDYYRLYLRYNNDSILTNIDFIYYPTPSTPRIHLSYRSLVNTIIISYKTNGELYSYTEKVRDTLVRHYTFKINKKHGESLALDTVRINGILKIFEVYYFKTKLSRLYTLDAYTSAASGFFLLSPNIFGQYRNIIFRDENQWLYDEYNGPFGYKSIYCRSTIDDSIYYYIHFNYLGRVTHFNVLKEYSDFNQFNTFYLRNGKIKKFEEKRVMHSKKTNI